MKGFMRPKFMAAAVASVSAVAVATGVIGQSASGWDLSVRALLPGANSSGGGFSTHGVVGQPVSGSSTGGNYAVTAGFYAGGSEKFRRRLPFIANDGTQP
jgi:hypothetical protein